MKKLLFFLFAVIAITMTSCDKEDEETYSIYDTETEALVKGTTWVTNYNSQTLVFDEYDTNFTIYNTWDLRTEIGSGKVNFWIGKEGKYTTTYYLEKGYSYEDFQAPPRTDTSSSDNYQTTMSCLGLIWTKQ